MLKKNIKKIIAALLLALTMGSVSYAADDAVLLSLISKAKENNPLIGAAHEKTIKAQAAVKEAFGEPNDTDIMSDGQVKWLYSHIKRSAMARNYVPVVNWFSAGTDDTTKKLVLIFKDGILVDFSSSTAKGETKAGVLS